MNEFFKIDFGEINNPTIYNNYSIFSSPYTTLSRKSGEITVNCFNLNPEKRYKILLYTCSRHNGTKQTLWYHPADANDVGENKYGYTKFLGNYLDKEGRKYPAVPNWMKLDNGTGNLTTEWELNGNNLLSINYSTWILPLVKPSIGVEKEAWEDGSFEFGDFQGIIGSRTRIGPILFRFYLQDENKKIYPSFDTFGISARRVPDSELKEIKTIFIKDNPENGIKTNVLFTQIR